MQIKTNALHMDQILMGNFQVKIHLFKDLHQSQHLKI
jgi:hypothetical protein